MLTNTVAKTQSSSFDLKNRVVVLLRQGSGSAVLGIQELEAFRTQGRSIPASKHGLETICGASCETGAQ